MLFSGEDTDNTHSDDITNAQNPEPEYKASNKEPVLAERKVTKFELLEIAKKKGYSEAQICKKYNVDDVKYIKAKVKIEAYDKFSDLPDKV